MRTLLKPGALKNITDELNTYILPVVALQEVRWSGIGIVKSANSTLFYSGSGCEKHERGVGFLIREQMLPNIKKFPPINDRLCYITGRIWDECDTLLCFNGRRG